MAINEKDGPAPKMDRGFGISDLELVNYDHNLDFFENGQKSKKIMNC